MHAKTLSLCYEGGSLGTKVHHHGNLCCRINLLQMSACLKFEIKKRYEITAYGPTSSTENSFSIPRISLRPPCVDSRRTKSCFFLKSSSKVFCLSLMNINNKSIHTINILRTIFISPPPHLLAANNLKNFSLF